MLTRVQPNHMPLVTCNAELQQDARAVAESCGLKKCANRRNRLLRQKTAGWWPQKALSVPHVCWIDATGSSEIFTALSLPTGCRWRYCIFILYHHKQPQLAPFVWREWNKKNSRRATPTCTSARLEGKLLFPSRCLRLCDRKRDWLKDSQGDRQLYLHWEWITL